MVSWNPRLCSSQGQLEPVLRYYINLVSSCFPLHIVSQPGVAGNRQLDVSYQTSLKSSGTSQSRSSAKNNSYHFLQMPPEEGLLFFYLLNDCTNPVVLVIKALSLLCLQSHKNPTFWETAPEHQIILFFKSKGNTYSPTESPAPCKKIQSSLGHGAAMARSFSWAR